MILDDDDKAFLNRMFGGELEGYVEGDLPFLETRKHVEWMRPTDDADLAQAAAKDMIETLRQSVLYEGLGHQCVGWARYEVQGRPILAIIAFKPLAEKAAA